MLSQALVTGFAFYFVGSCVCTSVLKEPAQPMLSPWMTYLHSFQSGFSLTVVLPGVFLQRTLFPGPATALPNLWLGSVDTEYRHPLPQALRHAASGTALSGAKKKACFSCRKCVLSVSRVRISRLKFRVLDPINTLR